MRKETLHVELLGRIELKNSRGGVNRQTLHSGRLTHLLLYFLLHRQEELTMQRLCDVLWKEGASDNPTGALKNLMYRLRSSLKVLGKQSFIITGNGSYRWNSEIPMEADFEQFEKKYQNAMNKELTEEERIENAEEAFELYKGRLPENLLSETWVLPIDTYYLSIYLDIVKILANYYTLCEDYQRAEKIAGRGLLFVGYNEELHCMVIESLMKQDKQALAISHYNKAITQFYQQQGTKERDKLDELYEKFLAVKNTENGSLEQVVHEIDQDNEDEGVFMCEYGVFKEIYRLERRRMERSSAPELLLLLTMNNREGEQEMEQKLMNKMMSKVVSAVKSSVRKGDVASRYSDNQYMLLLIDCNRDAAEKAAERVIKNFRRRARAPYVELSIELWEVSSTSGLNVEEIMKTRQGISE